MTDKTLSGAPSRAAASRKRGAPTWRKTFLSELAATSNVSASTKKAGVTTSVVYDARRNDAAFYRRWREALCEGYEHLEMTLLHRLRIGELKPPSGKRGRTYDNATAFRLLAAHRETAAQERAMRENDDADAILASIDAKLESMRQRALAASAGETDANGA